MERLFVRRALGASGQLRVAAPLRSRTSTFQNQTVRRYTSSGPPPTVFSISFWKSLVPTPLRQRPAKKKQSWWTKEWNPASFYIIVFTFIGSMSIQMITLRKNYENFMRRADVRIGLLRDVVESLQRGEDVDVEKALGTGDAQKEMEWEEALREIEQDDTVKNKRKPEKTKPSPVAATADKAESKQEPASTGAANQTKMKSAGSWDFF